MTLTNPSNVAGLAIGVRVDAPVIHRSPTAADWLRGWRSAILGEIFQDVSHRQVQIDTRKR
jgi:hypothetical protein